MPQMTTNPQRSQYDYAKRSQTKTNTHIPFDRTLVMDRFLAGAEPDKRERSITLTRDMMRMRARRHELKNHKPLSIPDTFRFVREALAADSTGSALGLTRESSADLAGMATDLSTDILDALEVEAVCADTEIADLETRLPQAKAALEALWSSSNEVEYELVSVFVHGGTGTGGHYWTYQAHLDTNADTNNTNNNKNNAFFYYSDETVKPVTADEVFADQSAQGVSPALLCYVRKNREIVDTLHREAAPLEGEDQQQQGQQQGQQEEQKRQQTQAGTADEPIALD
jgi:ubiquitin carboxyl-terminal hydrolase 25/28